MKFKMKKLGFTISLGIVIVGLTAFEITKKVNENDRKNPDYEKTVNTATVSSLPVKQINFGTIYAPNTELNFSVKGKENHSVTKEKLKNSKMLGDIIDYYPENWVDNYESVEISSVINGKLEKADGTNNVLNREQKRILQSALLASNINISVKYKSKNSVTGILEASQMNVTITVIPEKEAEFKSGYNNLI